MRDTAALQKEMQRVRHCEPGLPSCCRRQTVQPCKQHSRGTTVSSSSQSTLRMALLACRGNCTVPRVQGTRLQLQTGHPHHQTAAQPQPRALRRRQMAHSSLSMTPRAGRGRRTCQLWGRWCGLVRKGGPTGRPWSPQRRPPGASATSVSSPADSTHSAPDSHMQSNAALPHFRCPDLPIASTIMW